MPDLALAGLIATTTLFPSFENAETSVDGFARDVVLAPRPVPGPFTLDEAEGGFGVSWRTSLDDKGAPIVATSSRLRFVIDRNADGDRKLMWEDLTLAPGLFLVMARPSMGTVFDMGIGPYQTEVPIVWRHTGGLQMRLYVPATLIPLGFSNTDQDADARIKYNARFGGGAGIDLVVGTGKFLVGLRGQGDWQYVYRAGGQSTSHGRSDAEWQAEVSLGFKQSEERALFATFFLLDRYQWTYGTTENGPHRTSQTIGGRLSLRIWPKQAGIELPNPDELNRQSVPTDEP